MKNETDMLGPYGVMQVEVFSALRSGILVVFWNLVKEVWVEDTKAFHEMTSIWFESVFGKTADQKTITQYHTADGISIIPYHLWIQMIKTIIDYYVEFEHVQIAW